eukprot:gnl/MRDRNA2_/MRDRNA2_19599_c0_seq1.p1 gnl/MRDRNA2_/MRDRNA2_19599_c0~~gnl/MRDRNA2_/MRDRNA2_19599_c0_seq1.p1  ORF type:complete len:401 (-),score=68.44 gnl/MRDRNA2_/MRDRNA2_19599_c0_seq1:26-1228(-)
MQYLVSDAPSLRRTTKPEKKKVGRGWNLLQDQLRQYHSRRKGLADLIKEEVLGDSFSEPTQPRHSQADEDAQRTFFRDLDLTFADKPQVKEVWKKSEALMEDLRKQLKAAGSVQRTRSDTGHKKGSQPDARPRQRTPGVTEFMPRDWYDTLSEECLANLVVDTFMNPFVDALIEGTVTTVESEPSFRNADNEQHEIHIMDELIDNALKRSASAPSVPQQQASSWAESNSKPKRERIDSVDVKEPVGPNKTELEREMWSLPSRAEPPRNTSLESRVERIRRVTDLQRPRRKVHRRPISDQRTSDHPMTAHHFPQAWSRSTCGINLQGRAPRHADRDRQEEQFSVTTDGFTQFPYSLAAHRAFLRSQGPLLESAKEFAPMKTTVPWHLRREKIGAEKLYKTM